MDFINYKLNTKELLRLVCNTEFYTESSIDSEQYRDFAEFLMKTAKVYYHTYGKLELSDFEVNRAANEYGLFDSVDDECLYRYFADELLETLSKKCTNFKAYQEI